MVARSGAARADRGSVLLLLTFLASAPSAALAAGRCQQLWPPRQPGPLLSCQLAGLRAQLAPAQLLPPSPPGRQPPQRPVSRLHVRCVETGAPHGPMPTATFRLLPRLQDLRIEQCLLPELTRDSLEGLQKLENLTFRTNGVEWSTAASLRIHSDTFAGLPALEHLDLGGNNLWSLPAGVFCPLQRLISLNLTNNRLGELSNVSVSGRGGQCPLTVRELDVSGNRLVTLTATDLAGLSQLTRLLVDRNEISELGDGLLQALPQLQVLNVSNNHLTALPPDALRGAEALTELYLQSNQLRVMAPGALTDLPHLQILDLSWNRLSDEWVNTDTLAKLPELLVLRLTHNNLSRLDAALFSSIAHLHVLNLSSNTLHTLSDEIFGSLKGLVELNLDHNRLKSLSGSTLTGLSELTALSMKGNQISDISEDAFVPTLNIRTLNLANNMLQTIPRALTTLKHLKALDLSSNRLVKLDDVTLALMPRLFALELEGNHINDLTNEHFKNMTSLRALNLARNAITELPDGVFENLQNLQMLRLDSNLLSSLSGSRVGLKNLRWLNASNNLISSFDYVDVPRSLVWLDLHANRLSELSNSQELEQELALRTLDVSYNHLTALSPFQLPDSLETLVANDNTIAHVYPYTFFRKPNISRVDLFANQITTIDSNAFRLNLALDRQRPEFYIGGNPVMCDCRLAWLGDLKEADVATQYPRLMDEESIFCRLAFTANRDYMPLVEVARAQFLCPYESHCAALCQCCQFDACDCEMACPKNCSCYRTDDWSGNIVDCTAAGYTALPDHIPMHTTELYLDGNLLPKLSSHGFLGRRRLFVLYLNNSHVSSITNRTFTGLTNLQVLHLEDNTLTRLFGYEFETLSLLRELYLHRNAISVIANGTFAALASLQVLRLDGNQLFQFSPLELARHVHLSSVNLSGNSWSCECRLLAPFAKWLVEAGSVVVNAKSLVCYTNSVQGDNSDSRLILDSRNATSECQHYNGTTATRVGENDSSSDYVFIVCVSVIAAIVVVVAVIVYVFWHEMRVMAYAKYGVRIFRRSRTDGDRSDGKLFDAFISYSLKDEPFVIEVLARRLHSVQLCLHHRDLDTHVLAADTIVHAVESSRRTIVVLSEHFVASEWSRCEVRSALRQALSGRGRQLIVIVLGELSPRLLDADLRLYLKTSAVLHWRHSLFWHKLWYELPDVRQHRKAESPPVYEYPMAVHI